jgi:hypothetical protein
MGPAGHPTGTPGPLLLLLLACKSTGGRRRLTQPRSRSQIPTICAYVMPVAAASWCMQHTPEPSFCRPLNCQVSHACARRTNTEPYLCSCRLGALLSGLAGAVGARKVMPGTSDSSCCSSVSSGTCGLSATLSQRPPRPARIMMAEHSLDVDRNTQMPTTCTARLDSVPHAIDGRVITP